MSHPNHVIAKTPGMDHFWEPVKDYINENNQNIYIT